MTIRTGLSSRRFTTRVYGTDHVPPTPVPTPDLRLTTNGATYSAGKLLSWLSEEGFAFTPTATLEPLDDGPELNGHQGVLFGEGGGRAVHAGSIIAGTSNDFTFACTYWPHNAAGAGDREYLCCVENASSDADFHGVFPHQSNFAGLNKLGVFTNPWHYIDAAPTHRPQRIMYTYDGAIARAYRDGVFLGSSPASATTAKYFAGINIGAAYGSPVVAKFRGAIFDASMWCDRVLSSDHAAADAAQMESVYGYDTAAVYPDDVSPSTITLRLDSRGKYTYPSAQFDGTSLGIWTDYSGNGRFGSQSAPGTFPVAGSYLNGQPSVRIGTGRWMGISEVGGLGAFMGTGAQKTYDVKTLIKPNSITSTQATTIWLRDIVIGDNSEFWSINLFNNSGVPSVGLYHYGGATYQLSYPITIGQPSLVHAWFDGTTIRLRVNDGAVQSTSAANVSFLSAQLNLGYAPGAVIADCDIADITFRNAVDSSTMNSDRSYYSRVFGVDV